MLDNLEKVKVNTKEEVIKSLSKNKDDLISFLMNADKVYFMYVLNFLEELILEFYSENFMKEFKEKVVRRYNDFSDENYKRESLFKYSD